MVTIRSNVVPAAEAYLKLKQKQIEDAAFRALSRTGIVAEARVKSIIEKEAYDTGRLLRSVKSTIYRSANELRLVVGTNLVYAFFVEFGRKPGKWPNLDALTAWVGRKLRRQGINARVNVTFDQLKELARTHGKPASAQQRAYRLQLTAIYLIGRKIATKGIRQKLIFRRIQDGVLAYFRVQLARELSLIR